MTSTSKATQIWRNHTRINARSMTKKLQRYTSEMTTWNRQDPPDKGNKVDMSLDQIIKVQQTKENYIPALHCYLVAWNSTTRINVNVRKEIKWTTFHLCLFFLYCISFLFMVANKQTNKEQTFPLVNKLPKVCLLLFCKHQQGNFSCGLLIPKVENAKICFIIRSHVYHLRKVHGC